MCRAASGGGAGRKNALTILRVASSARRRWSRRRLAERSDQEASRCRARRRSNQRARRGPEFRLARPIRPMEFSPEHPRPFHKRTQSRIARPNEKCPASWTLGAKAFPQDGREWAAQTEDVGAGAARLRELAAPGEGPIRASGPHENFLPLPNPVPPEPQSQPFPAGRRLVRRKETRPRLVFVSRRVRRAARAGLLAKRRSYAWLRDACPGVRTSGFARADSTARADASASRAWPSAATQPPSYA
jgi:hypothetical protein